MPEIKNEIPSDRELGDYFIDHINGSCLAVAYYGAAVQEHRSQEWAKPLVALYEIGFGQTVKQIADSILDSLHRLNRLPRSDPFWDNTNKRPTIFKLNDFCKRLLRENPDDVLCLRCSAALEVFHGSNSFGQHYWTRLHKLAALEVSWPIVAGLISEICVGST
ncbi:MAG TPA: hypothetical protein VFV34_28780, partial [Blastocatellia bacterium]|nr:hypothetical protein [Blastocatellia bacterium]